MRCWCTRAGGGPCQELGERYCTARRGKAQTYVGTSVGRQVATMGKFPEVLC